MNIGITNDHAGFQHKLTLLNYLKTQGYTCIDAGANSADSVDYPEFAHRLARLIADGTADAGFAICGTGNGMAMSLNRHAQIRAGLAWNSDVAKLIKQHNNANICVMPAYFLSENDMPQVADAFLNACFQGGRHQRRVEMIELPQ
jgi:ribose 5-phosphate isomerase B